MIRHLILIVTHLWKPTAADIAKVNSAEYQRQALAHRTKAAYHEKMAEYYEEGINRLATHTRYVPSIGN